MATALPSVATTWLHRCHAGERIRGRLRSRQAPPQPRTSAACTRTSCSAHCRSASLLYTFRFARFCQLLRRSADGRLTFAVRLGSERSFPVRARPPSCFPCADDPPPRRTRRLFEVAGSRRSHVPASRGSRGTPSPGRRVAKDPRCGTVPSVRGCTLPPPPRTLSRQGHTRCGASP